MADFCAAYTFNDQGRMAGICGAVSIAERDGVTVCGAHQEGVISVCGGCNFRLDRCRCRQGIDVSTAPAKTVLWVLEAPLRTASEGELDGSETV